MYDVVGIDMPCVDFAMNVPSMPKPNSSMHFHRLSFQGGNKVSTGMVAAARLGAKCAILGAVGDEQFGRFCVTDFARHGIDSIIKFRRGETTALSFVLSDDETRGRSIVYHPGTCGRMTIEELPIQVLRDTKYFYLDSMFQNENYEKNCRKVLEMGPEIVIFTFGAKGCCGVSKNGEFFRLDAYSVSVEDTVGAGDVFHGAFLAALIRGMTVRDAAQFSSAVSAIKCTRIGGRAGIPNYDTTIRFMQTGKIDYTEIDTRVRFYENGLG